VSEVTGITARVRVLSPAEVAERQPAEPVDEPDDFDDSPSPQLFVVAWFAARLDDGRVVEGPTETRIGTGLSEDGATEDAVREVIQASLGGGSNFALEHEERWDGLIERLAQHGVRATPEQLDAVDRDVAIDMGHLAA
jgi:hypothetical protein